MFGKGFKNMYKLAVTDITGTTDNRIMQGDALVPLPIVGQIETIQEAVGSLLAWLDI